ncbi:MAG: hypothetical protein ABJB33_05760 [Gemmatimonadota bacterium]
MRPFRLALAALASLALSASLVATPAAAQGNGFYSGKSATTGVQFKSYSFGDGAEFEKATQFAIPFAIVVPVSQRFSVDMGTFYAMTSATTATGGARSVSGLTDVQLRGSYMLGRDAAVLSLLVNLPTGTKFSSDDALTAGAAASNFLLFPVNSYANGFSVTAGVGVAKRIGEWGIGLAGSARMSAEYQPFSGAADTTYAPGFEGRIRLGADRNVGQGRVRFGLTYSTYGDDTFGAGSGADTKYSPGSRFIAEGAYSWPGLGGTMSAYVWDYYRMTGAADSASVSNGENIIAAGLMARRPMSPTTTFEPAIEGRFWSYNGGAGGGKVVGLVAGLRHRLNDRVSVVPNIRAEFGTLDLVGGSSASLTGLGASVFLRYGF